MMGGGSGNTRALACVRDIPAVTVCPLTAREGQQHRLLNLFLDRPSLTTDLIHITVLTTCTVCSHWCHHPLDLNRRLQ